MEYSPKGTVSNGVVNQLDQFPIEEFSSPLSGQIFELCDPELFSEVNSNSNCCNDANLNSYISNALQDNGKTNTATTTSTANSSAAAPSNTAINDNRLSVIFDSPDDLENEVNDPIDIPTFSPQLYGGTTNDNQQNQFDFSTIPSQNQLQYHLHGPQTNIPLVGPSLPSIFEDECLSFMPPNLRSNANPSVPSNAILESAMGSYFPGNINLVDNSTILNSGLYLNGNNEIQLHDIDFQGDNGGIFCPDSLPRIFNPNDLQALSNESQHVNGGGNSNPLASDLSSLEDSTFKIRKLSPEERKEKIHRYMKKRNERNFSKKIKYACRKTLADSRPRVRGRFAKNEELLLNESLRTTCSNHEDDTDDDCLPIVVKEEEMFDSSDIFAHISGVNSFKCNYSSIPSWL